MMYRIVVHPGVQKEIEKLYTKDKVRYEHLKKRLKILAEQPEIGKPLRNVLKGKRRIQIGKIAFNNSQWSSTFMVEGAACKHFF